jgi:hypothetical protein
MGKYNDAVKNYIDQCWKECNPPSIRDIMIACGIPSTSHASTVVHALPDMHFDKHGHPMPLWVVDAIRKATHET